MDLFEYQARNIFEAHGVPVMPGHVATTPEEVRQAAESLGGATVIKAQVQVGGRGKLGGVKAAGDPEQAYAVGSDILGMDIKGHEVESVMVTRAVDIAEEYYFSILLDRANRSYLAMCSVEGGMDIEQLAEEHPSALAQIEVDPLTGIDETKATEIARAAGFAPEVAAKVVPVLQTIYTVYHDEDATLVEVNPLVLTTDGDIVALDGKITLDDNADYRHEDREQLAQTAADLDPLEQRAKEQGLHYVKLDGSVGVIGNGAGLVMSTLDVVANAGKQHNGQLPANFLDLGGGASTDVMVRGMTLVLSDEQVHSVFVNVFGGITACDLVAEGIVGALSALGDKATKPIVVRIDGNNVDAGRKILADYDHPLVTVVATMDDAADKACELAAAESLAFVTH